MQVLEPLAGDVGVDGGGRYVGVAEQHLHGPQVGPVVEQVRGKAWRRVWGESGAVMPAASA